jgi:hypothetical protein
MVRVALLIGIVFASGCSRLAEHPLAVEAAQEVRANERVAELLGKPVECSRTVRGMANETDGIARLEFEARGGKATAAVVVEGKKTRNAWGVTKLEIQPAGGEKLSLTSDLVARTGTDTPAFDPNAATATPSATPPPPDEIEITLPPGPPGQ